jgi:heat shock protein HtpX
MKRVFLFILTNIAILAVMNIVLALTGANRFLTENGINYTTLFFFSLIVGFTGSFISLLISKWMAKRAYNIQMIKNPSNAAEEWLLETVRVLAKKAKIQMPEVGVYDSPEVNAFATGPSRSDSLVAVSSGLLRAMNKTETEGVLAHEVAHIANGDMVTMTLLQGVLNTFVVFLSRVAAYFIDAAMRKGDDNSGPGFGYFIASFVCEMILGVLASMIVMAYSRTREFAADAAASRLLGDKEPMIAGLRRLTLIMDHGGVIDDRSPAISAFKISGKRGGMLALFASHPPLEDRIEALQKLRLS